MHLGLSQKDQKGDRLRRGLRRECFDDRREKNQVSKQQAASKTRPWPSKRTAREIFCSTEETQDHENTSCQKDKKIRGPPVPSSQAKGDLGTLENTFCRPHNRGNKEVYVKQA